MDSQLKYQQSNQDYFLGIYREQQPVDPDRDSPTAPSFLSDSVTGTFIFMSVKFYIFVIFYFYLRLPEASKKTFRKRTSYRCRNGQASLFYHNYS